MIWRSQSKTFYTRDSMLITLYQNVLINFFITKIISESLVKTILYYHGKVLLNFETNRTLFTLYPTASQTRLFFVFSYISVSSIKPLPRTGVLAEFLIYFFYNIPFCFFFVSSLYKWLLNVSVHIFTLNTIYRPNR